jgi:hypothetical protein
VAPIVEGHGEVDAVRLLLQRIWLELLDGEYIDVMKPIRKPRNRVVTDQGFTEAVELAAAKLRQEPENVDREMVLVLLDADPDLACDLGARLKEQVAMTRSDLDVSCVLANVEYETWFVAAAESLVNFVEVRIDDALNEPESSRLGKGWIQSHFKLPKYGPRRFQPRMTAAMDLDACRGRSPSFARLCRELEQRR